MKKQLKVLLYPNLQKEYCVEAVRKVAEKLGSLGISVVLLKEFCEKYPDNNIRADQTLSEKEGFAESDLAIVLGGDGTMLSAAHIACFTDTPLLGINLGTLGYMSELELKDIDLLEKLTADLKFAERMMINVFVKRNNKLVSEFTALNEAIISRGAVASMVKLNLFCDGSLVNSYRADGLIVSTPTGSSAYSMSAGGPIIDTKINAFCVCPICSHSLAGARPLVFSPHSVIEIEPESEKGCDIMLTADGRYSFRLKDKDRIYVKRSAKKTRFVKLKKDAFYDVLKRKLT